MTDKVSLTKENIKFIIDAFSHFFPEGIIYSVDKPYVSGEFNWNNRKGFIEFVFRLTGIKITSDKDFKNIKNAEQAVIKLAGVETQNPEANIPGKETREAQEKEREQRESAKAKAKVESDAAVKAAIAKQQEIQAAQKAKKEIADKIRKQEQIQESLKDKKVYAKVEAPPSPEPSSNVKVFINEAKNHPQSFRQDLAKNIREKISPIYAKTLTNEEIDFLADKVAFDTVYTINNPRATVSSNTQAAILSSISKDASVVPAAIPNKDTLNLIRDASKELVFFKDSMELSRRVLSSVDNDLALTVFGPDPSDIKVSLSSQPMEGYTNEVHLDQLNHGYINLLQNQSGVFDSINSLATDGAKKILLGQARTFLNSQIAKLPADSVISGVYNSAFGQQILSFVGLEETVPLGESFLGGFIQQIPGATGFFEGLGNTLEIDFGFTAAAPVTEMASTTIAATEGVTAVEAATVTTGVETGVLATAGSAIGTEAGATVGGAAIGAETGIAAVGTGIGAGEAATATGLGALIGNVPGLIIGAIVGLVVSTLPKIKKFIEDHKDLLLFGGIGTLLAGLLTGSVPLVLVGTPITIAGASSFIGAGGGLRSATTSLFGSIGSLFKVLGSAFLGAVGLPIMIILVSFPVVVALMLFIINSGAYVVPPTGSLLSSSNPYIDVQKSANPSGQVASPTTITYTITITAKKDTLTNITFKNDCQAIKKDNTKIDCKGLENIPSTPLTITPSNPFVFTFTSNYGSNYQNSLITDNINVSATSESGGKVSETGSASVCFGDCPLNCFDLNDTSWSAVPSLKSNLTQAAAQLAAQYPNFASKVCAKGVVKLCYTTSDPSPVGTGGTCNGTFYARDIEQSNCNINFNQCGIRSTSDALYILTHETTHHIQAINGSYQQLFNEQVPQSEWSLCTYNATAGNDAESMAEGDALYVGRPSWNNCITNYINQYPKHYLFAKSVMFAP